MEYYCIENLPKGSNSISTDNYYKLIPQPQTIKQAFTGKLIPANKFHLINPYVFYSVINVHFFVPYINKLLHGIKNKEYIYNNAVVTNINEIREPLNDYKKGFIKGYNDFDNELNSKLLFKKDDHHAIKMVLDYIENNKQNNGKFKFLSPKPKPPYLGTGYIVKNGDIFEETPEKEQLIIPQKQWFECGYNAGKYYKAWYLVVVNYKEFDGYLNAIATKTTHPEATEAPEAKKEKTKKKTEINEKLHITDIMQVSYWNDLKTVLASKKLVDGVTGYSIDTKGGKKTFFCRLLKHLHSKGYYGNKELTNGEIKIILKNTFGIDTSIDTIKKATPEGANFQYIKYVSEISKK